MCTLLICVLDLQTWSVTHSDDAILFLNLAFAGTQSGCAEIQTVYYGIIHKAGLTNTAR